MRKNLLKQGVGRFFRGNLHCHSNRSDGLQTPEYVAAAYRDAGYDFILLSDHFEASYGWQVTDTRDLRDDRFTTIIGAELSSGPWDERHCYWITAAGLPLDFEAPPPGNLAEAITRAAQCGAFVTMLHPGLNNLPLAAVPTLPAFDAVHAVEIYNHNTAMSGGTDRAHGGYMLDGLLEQGYRLFVNAGDDAHFGHPADRFGGWVEVYCDQLDPSALLEALHAGRYYSTQGPALHELLVDGNQLHVETSEVYAIGIMGSGERWQSGTERTSARDATIAAADFDISPFHGSYCRVTAVDWAGRCAWSNPIWP